MCEDHIQEECHNEEEQVHEENNEEQLVTLCSFTNLGSTKTLKYKGIFRNTVICVLVYIGATHSFINPVLIRELQLKPIPKLAKVFRSAGDEKPITNQLCPKIVFLLQNHPFEAALRVLNVLGYDMVLGCNWLTNFGDIKLNLMKGLLPFEKEGHIITLSTVKEQVVVHCSEEDIKIGKEEKKGNQVFLAQLFHITEDSKRTIPSLNPIILTSDAKPINLRPYRFSYFQKLEIEKIT
jgi:Retroviral aspartyl protease